MSLLEGLEGGGGLAAETEGGGEFGPVELGGCASLLGVLATGWFGVEDVVLGCQLTYSDSHCGQIERCRAVKWFFVRPWPFAGEG